LTFAPGSATLKLSMKHQEPVLELKNQTDKKIAEVLAEHKITLTVDEAKKIATLLKRNPTLTEATIWGIQGSEHSSYKSSRKHLSQLPTSGPNVILGPSEDAGIVEIAREPGKNGLRYGIVMAHESHNHPSQVVPYEGAATGVGGCVRDVLCMGAHVIAAADGLRFGEVDKNECTTIAEEVINGVGGYGNPIGVPNLAGDTYFNHTFNTNCLVNVVALGVLREDEIIHSYAPRGAALKGYDIILVGKPTDYSGMGGAAFASLKLDKAEKEKNKGAVQEPNPFLKRHIMRATYDLFEILKKKKMIDKVGFKDLGAGGIMCVTVEMVERAGYGAEINLENVPVSVEGLPPHVIACGETQERLCWMVPKDLTKTILKHYNETWALPTIAVGAQASVIGKVTKGDYVLRYNDEVVCKAKPEDITKGLVYDRPQKEKKKKLSEPKLAEPKDYKKTMLDLLAHPTIAHRGRVYESYDKDVQALSIIEAGQADAGVMAPLWNREDVPKEIKDVGIALSLDGNPRYGEIDAYWQAVNAVVEGARNVAAVGATPWCITDCLNYGNPELPDQMYDFVQGVKGVADALRGIGLDQGKPDPNAPKKRGPKKKIEESALPCISGNVSLYNVSPESSIAPQALIATLGRMDDAKKAITMQLKEAGNELYLIGPRKNELGGSVYYELHKELGQSVPKPDCDLAGREIRTVTELITNGLVKSCHDISDGGLAVTLAEMCMGGDGEGTIGAKVIISGIGERAGAETSSKAESKKAALSKTGKAGTTGSKNSPPSRSKGLRADTKLFSETGGFVVEIPHAGVKDAIKRASANGVPLIKLGATVSKKNLAVFDEGRELFDLKLSQMRTTWMSALRDALNT